MVRRNNVLLSNIFSFLCLIAIVFLSLYKFSPSDELPKIENLDKIVHFCMYAGFSFTLMFDKARRGFCDSIQQISEKKYKTGYFELKYLLIVIIISTSLGILMEFAQKYLTTYRGFEYDDILSDFTGAAFGAILSSYIMRPILKIWCGITSLICK